MTPEERVQTIKQRLTQAFSPENLEIIDDSAQHHGHAGSRGGAGYYTVVITADCFKQASRVDAHRKIYAVLNDMIPHEIHALQIRVLIDPN